MNYFDDSDLIFTIGEQKQFRNSLMAIWKYINSANLK